MDRIVYVLTVAIIGLIIEIIGFVLNIAILVIIGAALVVSIAITAFLLRKY